MPDKARAREIAQAYADVVIKQYNPTRIILFGSYLNDNPHEYSDMDIAVVFNGYKGNWLETWGELFTLRRGIDDDIMGGIEPHMMDETSDRSGFLEYIMETGEVIYEDSDNWGG